MKRWLLHLLLLLELLILVKSEAIDGGWSPWSKYGSDCSASCGGGVLQHKRTCSNPYPEGGGKDCEGEDVKEEECNTQICPEDDKWTEWSGCSEKCGEGVQTRERLCGDVPCTGELAKKEEMYCNNYEEKRCEDLCSHKENKKICPKYAKCDDVSNSTHAKIKCTCVMGYVMAPDNKCKRPEPTKPTPRPIPTMSPVQKTISVVVTKTASTVLLILVGITLTIFILLRIFTPDRVIQMNMEIALEIAHLILMLPNDVAKWNQELCRVVSISMHFFFTACFAFMFLESVHMYSLVAFVVQKNGLMTRTQNVLVGWGLSLFVVIFGISFHFNKYGGEYQCWLQMDTPLMYAELVPILILVILTIIMTEAAGAADYKRLESMDEKHLFSAKMSQRSNLIIMPLILASWIIGTLSDYEQNLGLYSTFSILNTVIGVAIFMLHPLNNSEVRKKLKSLFSCGKSKRK